MTQTARATIETAMSAPGTSWASKRAASAAGITPVSRHQLRKTISWRVQRPASAPVGKQAGEHRQGTGDENEDGHHHEAAYEVLVEGREGQVYSQGNEDEQDGDLGDLAGEAFEEVGVFVMLAKVEELHVAHYKAHHEGGQVARAA